MALIFASDQLVAIYCLFSRVATPTKCSLRFGMKSTRLLTCIRIADPSGRSPHRSGRDLHRYTETCKPSMRRLSTAHSSLRRVGYRAFPFMTLQLETRDATSKNQNTLSQHHIVSPTRQERPADYCQSHTTRIAHYPCSGDDYLSLSSFFCLASPGTCFVIMSSSGVFRFD